MATLIPSYSISEFKKLKAHQLKEVKSCEISSDGEYLFTFLNGNTESSGYIKGKAEYLAMKSNAAGGKTIEEILEAESVPAL